MAKTGIKFLTIFCSLGAAICFNQTAYSAGLGLQFHVPEGDYAYQTAKTSTHGSFNFAKLNRSLSRIGGYQLSIYRLQELGVLTIKDWTPGTLLELNQDHLIWSEDAKSHGVNDLESFLLNVSYQDLIFERHNKALWKEISNMDDMTMRCDGGYSFRGDALSHSSCLRLAHIVGAQGMRFFIEEGRLPPPMATTLQAAGGSKAISDFLAKQQKEFLDIHVIGITERFENKAGVDQYSMEKINPDIKHYGGSALVPGPTGDQTFMPGCDKDCLFETAEANYSAHKKYYSEMVLPMFSGETNSQGEFVLGEDVPLNSVLDLSCFDSGIFGDLRGIMQFSFDFSSLLNNALSIFSNKICGAVNGTLSGWKDDFQRLIDDFLGVANNTVDGVGYFSFGSGSVQDAINDPAIILDLTTFEITPINIDGVLTDTPSSLDSNGMAEPFTGGSGVGDTYSGPYMGPDYTQDIIDLFGSSP